MPKYPGCRILFLLICLSCFVNEANGTGIIGPNDSVSVSLPFTRAGNLLLIQAKVGEQEGNFILDTGAPYLILNLTYFRDAKLLPVTEGTRGGITGSVTTVERTLVDSFRINELRYEDLEADLINLGHLENAKGVKILGLLGMQLFRQCEMIIDYESNLIHIHRIGRKEAKTYKHALLKDAGSYQMIPVTLRDDMILVNGELAGKKLVFLVDSGAESTVLDSRLPNTVFDSVAITGRMMMRGSGIKKVEALQGDMKNLRIGNHERESMPVLITNLEKMCFSYDECLDGMLSFDFLSLRKIGFNFVKREMYIWK
jgi:predicted aspartyl protease